MAQQKEKKKNDAQGVQNVCDALDEIGAAFENAAEAVGEAVENAVCEVAEELADALKTEKKPKKEPSEVEVLKDKFQRLAAEYDNYRKRTAKERLDLVPEITAGNVSEFLPVIDNLERALLADCSDNNYKQGIEMIYAGFMGALRKLGVTEIDALGLDFDPTLHQAVSRVDAADGLESGKVSAVLQKGYKIDSRIIRFAMVSIVK